MIRLNSIAIPIISIFLLFGCERRDEPVNKNIEDLDFIHYTIEDYYPFLGFKKINLNSIYNQYLPLVKDATNTEFETILVNLLSELKDGHANVYDKTGIPIYGYRIPRREKDYESFDTSLVKLYLNKEFKQFNGLFKYEILPDNIGYVYCSRFSGNISEYGKFDSILQYLKETKGLIFDIRHNGGGNNISAYYMIKRLISAPLEGTRWTKKGGGFYPTETYYPSGDYQYTKPTVLLINGVCFSAADGFANLCKKIPHITLIGDTTGGGGGVPEIFTLKNSKIKFRVPTRCEMRYDGEHVEWNGIPPDIIVTQTKNDIENDTDKQLERAIEFLNK